MKNWAKMVVLSAVLTTTIGSTAMAQNAQERAGELKTWREQCTHPDPDLRLAYLEAAVETNDSSIKRICTRAALRSDNVDVRNLGLRAAIAGIDQLTFDVEMPPELKRAIDNAAGNDDEIEKIQGWYIFQDYREIRTGLVFDIRDASVAGDQSNWHPLGSYSSARDDYKGKALIVGDKIRWRGKMSLSRSWGCDLDVQLDANGLLSGVVQCEDLWPMPVSAALL